MFRQFVQGLVNLDTSDPTKTIAMKQRDAAEKLFALHPVELMALLDLAWARSKEAPPIRVGTRHGNSCFTSSQGNYRVRFFNSKSNRGIYVLPRICWQVGSFNLCLHDRKYPYLRDI